MFKDIDTSSLRSRCGLAVDTIYTSAAPTDNTAPTVKCKTASGGRVDPIPPPYQPTYWDNDD